jgi:cytochrome o ubiquinol oxidase subunit III
MTDCILFATLFATYAVLHKETFGGPSSKELFSLSLVFAETMILLFSSITCGLGMLAALQNKKNQVLGWFLISFLLGGAFIGLELHEFHQLVQEGHRWTESAFLSGFFTLVGTHGLHVSIGLLWMAVVMIQLFFNGITSTTFRRLVIFSLFWHFLDLIWIFIFTFVYLMGVI